MKAKEFRIGNFISHDSCPVFRVDEIRLTNEGYILRMYLDDSLKSFLDMPLGQVRPIDLSREVLEKCGFKKFESGNFYYPKTMFELTPKFWLEGSERAVKAGSLHQLQNLYFALTGEELAINLGL